MREQTHDLRLQARAMRRQAREAKSSGVPPAQNAPASTVEPQSPRLVGISTALEIAAFPPEWSDSFSLTTTPEAVAMALILALIRVQ
jgi:hypothetical protein